MHKKELLNKLISEELRALRAKTGLNQSEVAESVGINKDTLSRYETNLSNAKIYILDKLLDYYGSNLKYFFTTIYDRLQKENE